MGEHKHNPTAIAAKNGELNPKPKGMGKAEAKKQLYAMCRAAILHTYAEKAKEDAINDDDEKV